MKRHFAAKRDKSEPAIVKSLRFLKGVSYTFINMTGVPDLLLGYAGRNYLIEVKTPGRWTLTPDQLRWHGDWKGEIAIAETIEDVVAALNYSGSHVLEYEYKNFIVVLMLLSLPEYAALQAKVFSQVWQKVDLTTFDEILLIQWTDIPRTFDSDNPNKFWADFLTWCSEDGSRRIPALTADEILKIQHQWHAVQAAHRKRAAADNVLAKARFEMSKLFTELWKVR